MLGTTSLPRLSRRRGGLFSIRLSRRRGGLFSIRLSRRRGGLFSIRLSRRRGGLFSIRLSRRCGGLFCPALIPPTWRIACPVFLVWIFHLRLAASGSWTSLLARPVDEPPISLFCCCCRFRVGICDFRLVVSGSWRLARWNPDEAILEETLFGMGVGSATWNKTMSLPSARYRSVTGPGEAPLDQAERGTSRLSLTKKHAWRQLNRL